MLGIYFNTTARKTILYFSFSISTSNEDLVPPFMPLQHMSLLAHKLMLKLISKTFMFSLRMVMALIPRAASADMIVFHIVITKCDFRDHVFVVGLAGGFCVG
jgi:hypothetical protein